MAKREMTGTETVPRVAKGEGHMPFRKGLDKVNEVAQRTSFSGGKNRYFNWEPGETKTIRFLTEGDQIVLTSLHEFITTHDGGKNSFVCAREVDRECELCGSAGKPRDLALAAAVWREEKKVDGKTTYKTKTEEIEVEEDGKTITKVVPWVGIMRQAPRNFWGWVYEAYDKHGTILDRDYSITRRGKKMETTYNFFQEDKQDLDLSKFEQYLPDLEEYLTWQSSKEYYDKYLRGIEVKKDEESSDEELTPEDLEALKEANEEVSASASSGEFD